MNKMTKTELENLQENDVIFAINPYEQSFDRQANIKIKRLFVRIIVGNKIITQDSSKDLDSIELESIHFIDDMLRGEIKGVFKTYPEACQYLQIVKLGEFSEKVKYHHDKMRK